MRRIGVCTGTAHIVGFTGMGGTRHACSSSPYIWVLHLRPDWAPE